MEKQIAVLEVYSPDFEEQTGESKKMKVVELTVKEIKKRNNILDSKYKYYKLEVFN